MLIAPADSPKTVTLPGSPPNAPMFSCTHSSAATWSSRPTFAMPSAEVEEALGAGAPVDDDADDAVAGEVATVVGRGRAELEHAALDPHHHRQTGRRGVGRPQVEVQAVLRRCGALDGGEGARDVVPVLAHHSARRWPAGQPAGAPGPEPWRRARRSRARGLRGSKPVRTEGRCRVRDSQERVNAVGDAAPQDALNGLDRCIHVDQVSSAQAPPVGAEVPGGSPLASVAWMRRRGMTRPTCSPTSGATPTSRRRTCTRSTPATG